MTLDLSGIVPERILSVKDVHVDEWGVRLEYAVAPDYPTPDQYPRSGRQVRALQEWPYEVSDDCGTRYTPGGGAHGKNEGVRTVVPTPPAEARELIVTIRPSFKEEPAYRFRVRIPGPAPWRVASQDFDLAVDEG